MEFEKISYRKLADVSRATRGVVLLLCDVSDAVRVMDVAKRLNMIDGHFVWLWIDTTARPATFLTPLTNQTLHLDVKPRRPTHFSTRVRRSNSTIADEFPRNGSFTSRRGHLRAGKFLKYLDFENERFSVSFSIRFKPTVPNYTLEICTFVSCVSFEEGWWERDWG